MPSSEARRPGTYYEISRRTERRVFLFRPDAEMNKIFLYALAVAAKATGVVIISAVLLSDHYHIVVLDVEGRVTKFTELLNGMLTKATQALRGWQGAVFDRQGPNYTELLTSEAVIKKIGYVAANPVAAGLVSRGELWPGVRTKPEEIGAGPFAIARPRTFFSSEGKMPEHEELSYQLPAVIVDELGGEPARVAISDAIEEAEKRARKHWEVERRPFKGARAVRRSSPFERATTYEQRHELRPRFAGDREAIKAAIARRNEFLRLYAAARKLWLEGQRDLVWPYGTDAMRRRHGVSCADTG